MNLRNCVLTIVALLCITFLSCRGYVDRVTPMTVDPLVANLAGVEPNDFGILGPTLHDGRIIRRQLVLDHRQTLLDHERAFKDKDFEYKFAFNIHDFYTDDAESTQQIVIGSADNPVSVLGLLAGLGLGGIGVVIGGKYRKRPGDLSPEEHELDVNGRLAAAYQAGVDSPKTE